MARWNGTTKERGYGSSHQTIRNSALASYRQGQPCAECGQPLTGPAASHDLAHDHINGGYKGLAHTACNRSEGSTRGNRMQPRYIAFMAGGDTRCKTCGKTYHYAAKLCEVCGIHYHPSGGSVRTCSRKCGVHLRRRIYGYASGKPPRPPKQPRTCQTCGVTLGRGSVGNCPECTVAQRPGRSWSIVYYTCRYCGNVGVTTARGTTRCVCKARECQLTRLMANNLIARRGLTREQADSQVAEYRAQGDHRGRSRNW
jgi:Recombination endonuclease VII